MSAAPLAAAPLAAAPPQQHWPCGPDCVYAEVWPATYGEWLWCHRPAAKHRLVRTGRDCASFHAAAYPGETPGAAALLPPGCPRPRQIA
jgi:hypothetical protein